VDLRKLNQVSKLVKKERGNSKVIREASRLWRALSIRQTDLLTLLKHLHTRVEALQQL
jgi:hypothetical protein